jgi:hypothetical protein
MNFFSVFFGTSTDMYKKFGAPAYVQQKDRFKKNHPFQENLQALSKPQPVHTCTVGRALVT